jgi:hypothetical protein
MKVSFVLVDKRFAVSRLVAAAIACTLLLAVPMASAALFISNAGSPGFVLPHSASIVTNLVGWQIMVGPSPLEITALGTWDFNGDGLESPKIIGVWETSSQTLLGSVVVAAGASEGTLIDQFRFTDLSVPITLSPNTSYTFGERLVGPGSETQLRTAAGVQFDSTAATFIFAGMNNGGAGQPFDADFATQMPFQNLGDTVPIMGPNFQFSVIPEPTSAFLTVFGSVILGFVSRRCLNSKQAAKIARL